MEKWTDNRDLALELMRCGQVYCPELHGSFSGSLLNFGIPEGRMVTPQSLKDRLPPTEPDLSNAKDPQKAEQLARISRLLIRAYEDKDRG